MNEVERFKKDYPIEYPILTTANDFLVLMKKLSKKYKYKISHDEKCEGKMIFKNYMEEILFYQEYKKFIIETGKEDEKKVMKYYRDLKEWRLSLEKITELSEKCDDFHKENYWKILYSHSRNILFKK